MFNIRTVVCMDRTHFLQFNIDQLHMALAVRPIHNYINIHLKYTSKHTIEYCKKTPEADAF